MLHNLLLVAHIAVLGYWLGSELVINSTFRYVCYSGGMPVAERSRLMDHVMEVDQHVRYALVLQFGLGLALAMRLGWLPGGVAGAWAAGVFAVAWLALVELTHRRRHAPLGARLAALDRGLRYGVMAALVGVAVAGLTGLLITPAWIAWKLLVFAGVMACGVGIRFALIEWFASWRALLEAGGGDAHEAALRRGYWRATGILIGLWVLIGVIVLLSLARPA
ncbi:MAG: hypothetical protein JJT93_00635 [Gammaproteobacteria bacterium]|nr:hypothetical protein [Gammaproteobacteria bacterium]